MTLDGAMNLLATAALLELMISIGLGVTIAEIAGVAKNWWLVSKTLLANYVCVPAAALGLLHLFQPHSLDPEHFPLVAAGFLITAVCPGAPFGPPFTGLARGNVVTAIGLMAILAASSALVAPLLLQVLLPIAAGDSAATVDPIKMIATLFFAQLLPLALGLAIRQWRPSKAARIKPTADRISLVLNLAMLAAVLATQYQMLLHIPARAYAGMSALVLSAVAFGWLLGGPGTGNRRAVAMATAVRNVGVGLVIATTSFPGTKAVTATMVFALFQTIVMALLALAWGKLNSGPTGSTLTEKHENVTS